MLLSLSFAYRDGDFHRQLHLAESLVARAVRTHWAMYFVRRGVRKLDVRPLCPLVKDKTLGIILAFENAPECTNIS